MPQEAFNLGMIHSDSSENSTLHLQHVSLEIKKQLHFKPIIFRFSPSKLLHFCFPRRSWLHICRPSGRGKMWRNDQIDAFQMREMWEGISCKLMAWVEKSVGSKMFLKIVASPCPFCFSVADISQRNGRVKKGKFR